MSAHRKSVLAVLLGCWCEAVRRKPRGIVGTQFKGHTPDCLNRARLPPEDRSTPFLLLWLALVQVILPHSSSRWIVFLSGSRQAERATEKAAGVLFLQVPRTAVCDRETTAVQYFRCKVPRSPLFRVHKPLFAVRCVARRGQ